MTAKTYRVDYAPDDEAHPEPVIIECGQNRRLAMEKARHISGRSGVGTAYAIATQDGRDIGQRVYCHGAYAYQDHEF